MGHVPKQLTSINGASGNDVIWADQAAVDALNTDVSEWTRAVNGFGGNDVIIRDRTGDYDIDGGSYQEVKIYGGAGEDTVTYFPLTTGISVDLTSGYAQQVMPLNAPAWMVPFAKDRFFSVENVTGANHADTILGDANANKLSGLGGDDTLKGMGGNDTIWGGTGDDHIEGGTGADKLYGGDDDDHIWGGDQNDLLEGGDGDDYLSGGNHDDTLKDGDGNDEMHGGSGHDKLHISDGTDEAHGGSGNDTFYVKGFGDNVIDGGTGGDMVSYAQAGGVTVFLGNGFAMRADGFDDLTSVEHMTGGGGQDFVVGSAGYNAILTGGGNDQAYGMAGDDHLSMGAGDDYAYGGDDDDRLYGEGGDDTLYGEAGEDLISGGSGDDMIVGGTGDDDLRGGADADTFRWLVGDDGYDRVRDFELGVDNLSFEDGYFVAGPGGHLALEDVLMAWNLGADSALVANTAWGGWVAVARFDGVSALDLQAAIEDGSILGVEVAGPGGPGGFEFEPAQVDLGVSLGLLL